MSNESDIAESAPLIDVVQHAPRYMVRCSRCGVVATNLALSEVEKERDNHRCYLAQSDGSRVGT